MDVVLRKPPVKINGKRIVITLILSLPLCAAWYFHHCLTDSERVRVMLEDLAMEHWKIPVAIREAQFGPGLTYHLKDMVIPLAVDGLEPLTIQSVDLRFHAARFLFNKPAFLSVTAVNPRIEMDLDAMSATIKKWRLRPHTSKALRLPFATFKNIFPAMEIKGLQIHAYGEKTFGDVRRRRIESIGMRFVPTSRHVCALRGEIHDDLLGDWQARAYLDLARMGGRGAMQCRYLEVTDQVRGQLTPGFQEVWDKFKLSGFLGCTAAFTLDMQNRHNPFHYNLLLHFKDVAMTYYEFPLRVSDIRGILTVNGEELRINRLEGRRGNATVSFVTDRENRIRIPRDQFSVKLGMLISNLPVDDDFRSAMPPATTEIFDRFRIEGNNRLADVVASFDFNPRREERFKNDLIFKIKGSDITYSGFPYPLQNVHGIVRLQPSLVTLTDLHAEHDGGKLVLSGTITLAEEGARTAIRVKGGGLPFDQALRLTLPEGVQKGWGEMRLRGHFDPDLTVTHDGAGTPPTIEGRLHLHDTSLHVGMPFEHVNGDIDFKVDPADSFDANAFSGQLTLQSMLANGIAIEDFEAPLKMDGNKLRLPKFRGTLYGGTLTGYLDKDLTPGGRYKGEIEVHGAKLKAFSKQYFSDRYRDLKGSMNVQYAYEGVVGDDQSMVGIGKVEIVNGKLLELPVFLGILSVLNFSPTADPMFKGAELVFTVKKRVLDFSKMIFLGNAWSLYGSGKVGFDKKCDLLFSISRIPVLSFILNQVVQVEVKGTIADPEPRIKPIPVVTLPFRILQALFGRQSREAQAVGRDSRRQTPKDKGTRRNGRNRRRRPAK